MGGSYLNWLGSNSWIGLNEFILSGISNLIVRIKICLLFI